MSILDKLGKGSIAIAVIGLLSAGKVGAVSLEIPAVALKDKFPRDLRDSEKTALLKFSEELSPLIQEIKDSGHLTVSITGNDATLGTQKLEGYAANTRYSGESVAVLQSIQKHLVNLANGNEMKPLRLDNLLKEKSLDSVEKAVLKTESFGMGKGSAENATISAATKNYGTSDNNVIPITDRIKELAKDKAASEIKKSNDLSNSETTFASMGS